MTCECGMCFCGWAYCRDETPPVCGGCGFPLDPDWRSMSMAEQEEAGLAAWEAHIAVTCAV